MSFDDDRPLGRACSAQSAPRRRTLGRLAAVGAAALLPGVVRAQPAAFPSRPVRIIVPQAPGGASDALARVMAARLGERWGQNVVVENRAGAGGNVGTEAVAKSPGDGHVLLMGYAGTNSINPALYARPGWEPKDLVGVATLAAVPFALVVSPQLGVANVEQFVAVARAKADAVGYGSAGNGSVNHLLGVMFGAAAGVQMLHVPYKGAAPAITDLIGGQVQAVFTSLPSVAGFIQRGQLRALAVTSPARSPAFPEIPTLAESGVRGMDVSPWFGLLAPAATPAAVVARINADVNALLATQEVKERFASSGADVLSSSPERFAELMRDDLARWAKVVRQSGAQVD
jgi:tripartite-type tricarboxylate transporter receptor subunit TctC